jgi:hypothetical protein
MTPAQAAEKTVPATDFSLLIDGESVTAGARLT